MELDTALRAGSDLRLAIVGAGGKTTALFHLARRLRPPVILTASTHLAVGQLALADRHLVIEEIQQLKNALRNLPTGVLLLTGAIGDDQRTKGLPLPWIERIFEIACENRIPVLLEADGSRQKPLKAPADHEPVIPGGVNQVMVVAGLSVLGKPLDEEFVHRVEQFSAITELKRGQAITKDALEKLLLHPQGGLKGIPGTARRIVMLNQADSQRVHQQALSIASNLLAGYDSVLVSSFIDTDQTPGGPVRVICEKTAGIILAAGAARRYGKAKAILPWQGQPLIRHVAQTALGAGLSPVIVITGAIHEPVVNALAGLPLQIVHNPRWSEGQSSSLRAGLDALAERVGAAIFLLADQPLVTVEVLNALTGLHRQTLTPVIAPLVGGRRANPVLFDRITFSDLSRLKGDIGGRAVFTNFPPTWLPWSDPNLLLDIDTTEDYHRLLELSSKRNTADE